MTVDNAAALEQLLKRFEALRGCGLVKLLAVEQPATSCHPRELPPGCAPFSSATVTTTSLYGTADGTGLLRVLASMRADSRFVGREIQPNCRVGSAAELAAIKE